MKNLRCVLCLAVFLPAPLLADDPCTAGFLPVTKADIHKMLDQKVPTSVILSIVGERGHEMILPADLADMRAKMDRNTESANTELLHALAQAADLYIGYSILPSKVVRDNYGHYVSNKFFAADVAIANRAVSGTIVISALEFCHTVENNPVKDISTDPTLVRGSLQKGELTGERSIASNTIQAIGSIMSPAAPFFKNVLHRATFSTAAAMFSPLKSAFDLVVTDTLAVYLTNWDKDQVFRSGFTVAAGGSQRGRVLIPIEYIYPKSDPKWQAATKGRFNPDDVKRDVGPLVALGQTIKFTSRGRSFQSQ